MRRAAIIITLLLSAAAYVLLQTTPPAPKLATLIPAGAMIYLEAPDFGRLLRDGDASQIKANWLQSTNYAVFSRSNLFTKLQGVYTEYGAAAGFLPDLKSAIEIAGTDSALALYEFRDVEFLYVSRISEAALVKSQLWAVRDKFEQRQSGGATFYLHSDPASKRTVAFAFAQGHLFVATRDDLIAQALQLLAVGSIPSVASERWYRETVAAASNPGELRLVMNLESIVKSVYFRSYWIQRNASEIRAYWAGLSDISRSGGNLIETRIFLRAPGATDQAPIVANSNDVSGLLALVPPEAGLYKVSRVREPSGTAALIVQKLIGVQPPRSGDWREAPIAATSDSVAGSEGDLETRIDEQPLPKDGSTADSIEAIRAVLEKARVQATLLVQSSSPAIGTFVRTPAVVVLAAAEDWDYTSVRDALGTGAGKLWTTSQLGASWTATTAGPYPVTGLDGLGALMYVGRGKLLFLSNDTQLLGAVLDRTGVTPTTASFTYAAGFRHARERANYDRVMSALDFASNASNGFGFTMNSSTAPPFFSGNIASLSAVLSRLEEVQITEQKEGAATIQKTLYKIAH